MSIIDTLITDRTQADVDRVKELKQKWLDGTITDDEKTEWLSATMKGAYNYTDMNRVGEAVDYLANRLEGAGHVMSVTPKTDWDNEDIPRKSELQKYRDEVAQVRSKISAWSTTPSVQASMSGLNYGGANDIEQVLTDIDTLLTNQIGSQPYCGVLTCSQSPWPATSTGVIEDPPTTAEAPTITKQPVAAGYYVGRAAVALSVQASVSDGGTLSYQWYTGEGKIIGATRNTYTPSTSSAGTTYYYCVVTNTLGNTTATTSTNAAAVVVFAYSVSFDANGGSGTQEKLTASTGTVVLPECTFTAPSGKTFSAWALGSASGTQYQPGTTYTVTTGTTFYAVWATESTGVHIFGVAWDTTSSSTALTRLTSASDPLGVVNVDITTEPVPAEGTGSGSSPFDSYAPWSGMEEYNVIDGAIAYSQASTEFDPASYDTVVKIPAFYYRITDDNSTRRFYIADGPADGFTQHPGSGKYLGRYATGAGHVSKSGLAPLVSLAMGDYRTNASAKGTGWRIYDYPTWCALWLLYLVEFADFNSQGKIGQGRTNYWNSTALNAGGTDSMVYHTGRAEGTDGYTAVQYRHIENPWGNVNQFVDGILFNSYTVYLCTDPDNYADTVTSNYVKAGSRSTSAGYISAAAYSEDYPWAFWPSSGSSGSNASYVSDYGKTSTSSNLALKVGGYWTVGLQAGLWYFDGSATATTLGNATGSRLIFEG